MRKFIAVIFLGLVAGSYSVQAACFNECKAVPECAKMGYKLEKEIFCPDGHITCPFDSQYIWCKEYTCKDGRYSDTKELTGEKGYVCDEVDYHHRKCYHCHCDPDPEECKWSNLNKGVGELGDRCCDGHYASCRNLCQDKVTVPAHAHGNKESCTGCNVTQEIITSWSCDDWYDQMGEACYARQCPDGYTITDARIEDCGSTKDKGWTWESKGQSGEQICGKCTPKSCLGDFSTDYPGVDSCGESGSKGWTWNQSGWSGDDACGKCTAKECLPGFSTQYSSIASCGTSGNKGWTWEQSDQYAGNDICGKCTKKECEEGDTDPDIKSCKFESDYLGSKTENGYYSEDKKCYTCHCAANDTNCHWSEGNKGQGRLETKCCNGKYATCTSNCVKVEVPDHGQCADHCTGCETEVCSAYSCDKGYQKDNSQTKCEVAPCANGSATEASKCGNGTGAEHGWEAKNETGHLSGEKKCYQCTMKDCPTGESTDYQDVSKCGTGASKGAGWTNQGTSNYHGDTRCYSCSKKACTGGYETKYKDVSSCGKAGESGWEWSQQGWSGDEVCGKCTPKTCPNGYSSEKKSIDDCGTTKDKGWTFEKSSTNSGENVCGKCDKLPCETNYNTNDKVNDCSYPGTEFAKKVASTTRFNGDATCYKCECSATNDNCPWTDDNKGNATLSLQCCNGRYKNCKSKCETKNPPEHAACSEYCTGCNSTVCVGWTCHEGYATSGSTCAPAACPTGYDTKYQSSENCEPKGSGWSVTFNGKSGETQCGQCVCQSDCKWNDQNKGNATLGDPCCNGNYAKCTSTCEEVEIPEHASCKSDGMCTGCGNSAVCTAWECDEGYHVNDAGTGCEEDCVKFATSPCAVGSVFFSDGTCASPEVCLPSDRIPVGVVYWVNDSSGQYGKVINLHDLGRSSSSAAFDPKDPYNTTDRDFEWGSSGTDITDLYNWNCDSNNYLTVAQTEDRSNPFWLAGMEYTQIIAETQGNDLKYPASMALAFYPDAALQTDSKVGAGNWYLPTLGELMDLYGYDYSNLGTTCNISSSGADGNTKTTVNATLTTLKNKGVTAEALDDDDVYWSSSEYSSYYAWGFDMRYGSRYGNWKKSYSDLVRVSLEFGCLKFETSPCAVGSIYFSDGTCASPEVCLPSDRVPVGVVYWVEDSGEYYKVINLKDLGKAADNQPFDSANSYDSNFPYLYWGYYGYDIVTLFNFEKYTKEKKLELLQNRASDLYDGKGNTDKILADKGPDCSKEQGTADYYQYCVPEAAKAVHAFYPPNVEPNNPIVGAGRWYLPAIGELMDLYGYDNAGIKDAYGTSGANGKNKRIINTTLRTLKSKGVEATELSTDKGYISSLEHSIHYAKTLAMKGGNRDYNSKTSNYHVRAGLEVGCPKKNFFRVSRAFSSGYNMHHFKRRIEI